MSVISWNCQGVATRDFVCVFKDMMRRHKPILVGLLEPRVSGSHIDDICKSFGFDQWLRIEAVGFSGGIWIFWNDELEVEVLHTNPQFFILKVRFESPDWWCISFVYGSPTPHLRKKLWNELTHDNLIRDTLWVSIGDYNAVVMDAKTSSVTGRQCSDFTDWIFQEGLMDLGFSRPSYTWTRGLTEGTFHEARLDRALANFLWCDRFPNAGVVHLPRIHSDHVPLLLNLKENKVPQGHSSFKFQVAWTRHPSFLNTIHDAWNKNGNLINNLEVTANTLGTWNMDTFGNIFRRKRKILARLAGIQRAIANAAPTRILKLETKLQLELDEILKQEELLWFQQSREDWITSGDLNTRFYHASLLTKKKRRKISIFQDGEGNWIQDQKAIRILVQNFYTALFAANENCDVTAVIQRGFPALSEDTLNNLIKPLSREEVKAAVFVMSPYKAAGPDGFHAGFYQNCWSIVGDSVSKFVIDFLNTSELPNVNDIMIALILKVDNPTLISQFRPISLCNVIFKIITKTLINRLKKLLQEVISPFQSSFVSGRQISDNIIILQEVLHSFRTKKGKEKAMILKIDLEKAYDMLSWEFIQDTLTEVGLPSDWVRNIMVCIGSSRIQIIWNNEKLQMFNPSKGLRQGDPLSFYIFILCIDRLSHIITESVHGGN